jgi:hypothetical protein
MSGPSSQQQQQQQQQSQEDCICVFQTDVSVLCQL